MKKPVTVWIEEDLLRRLREEAVRRYGSLRSLSRAVEEAVEAWLGQQAQAQVEVEEVKQRRSERRTAIDILRRQKVIFSDEVSSKLRSPEKFFESLEKSGAKVIELPGGRFVVVEPEFFKEFKEKVSKSELPSLSGRLSEVEARLLNELKEAGLARLDEAGKRWILSV